MVYNLFIFFSIFLLPEIPKNWAGLSISVNGIAADFLSKSESTYGFYDIMIVKRYRSHLFYYSYQEF